MNAKNELIDAIQSEIDNADFSNEETCDNSYQLFITKIDKIYKASTDTSLTIHDIVEVINIVDNLELSLIEAYQNAINYLQEATNAV